MRRGRSVGCTTVARMRKIVVVVLGGVMALAAASCSSSSSTPTSSKTPTTAGVGALQGKTGEQILTAATDAAKKAGTARYVLERDRRHVVPNHQW